MEEVDGSIPSSSTLPSTTTAALAFFLGGLIAGEGSFTSTRVLPPFADGTERRRFVFSVEMGDDRVLVASLGEFFGVGSLTDLQPRRAGYLPTTRFAISSNRRHLSTTIPFADGHLLPSAKRRQFETWRAQLTGYLSLHPTRWGRGPSTCARDGCSAPVRGRGLCRSHYYEATGY